MAGDHRFAAGRRRSVGVEKQIEGPFTKNLWVIATMMIVVGVLMMIAELVGKRDHGMDQLRCRTRSRLGRHRCWR
jgi:undecaprenyl pyrophosphate phosphatase UppP